MSRSRAAVQGIFVCVLGLSLLSAAPKKEKNGTKVAKAGAPVASAAKSTLDPKSFTIGPEDILRITVWRDNEVSAQVMVRPDGKITLQLLGEIQAAGLTPEALSQVVFDGLSKLKTIDRSEVTVTVVAVNSKKYFIQGEVFRPGSYPLLVPTTILEAMGYAGGFKEFANQKDIVLIRKGGERFKFNYKEVIAGKKLEQNRLLEPGDQIIVH
jgi:polysaccharide export outer membrane protein